MADLMFPILQDEQIKAVPWEVFAAHEQQAQSNHDQTLNRLAQRGGLSCMEACSVIADVPLRDMRTDVGKSYWRALLMRRVYEHEVNSASNSKEPK